MGHCILKNLLDCPLSLARAWIDMLCKLWVVFGSIREKSKWYMSEESSDEICQELYWKFYYSQETLYSIHLIIVCQMSLQHETNKHLNYVFDRHRKLAITSSSAELSGQTHQRGAASWRRQTALQNPWKDSGSARGEKESIIELWNTRVRHEESLPWWEYTEQGQFGETLWLLTQAARGFSYYQ